MPQALHEDRSPAARSRLDGIDALRALAIFHVLMNHINMRLFFAHIPYLKLDPLAYQAMGSGTAVSIFRA